jgi:hypothetical protein
VSKLRYFARNITILNLFLMIAVFITAAHFIVPFFNVHIVYNLPSQKKSLGKEEAKEAERYIPSPSDYVLIAEENLFHPERKIPPEKKEEQPLPVPDFVLYGTIITDDLGVAYMEDLKAPRNTAGRGKRQVALKKGDSFSGFTLKEIEADKVVMVRGEEKMMVPLIDPQKPKARVVAATTVSQKTPAQPPLKTQRAAPQTVQPQKRITIPASAAKHEPPPDTTKRMAPVDEEMSRLFQR